MANETTSGSNGFLYFIVGALLVAVIGFGILSYTGRLNQSPTDRAIEHASDAVAGAADAVQRRAQ